MYSLGYFWLTCYIYVLKVLKAGHHSTRDCVFCAYLVFSNRFLSYKHNQCVTKMLIKYIIA